MSFIVILMILYHYFAEVSSMLMNFYSINFIFLLLVHNSGMIKAE